MKIKTSELIDGALDWAVAKCEGCSEKRLNNAAMWLHIQQQGAFRFSTDWSQGGPIIDREHITIRYWDNCPLVHAYMPNIGADWAEGPTALIAAMRCYCCSKLGDVVDIPEELCQQQKS